MAKAGLAGALTGCHQSRGGLILEALAVAAWSP